jgi:probable addiction module antidote protein
MSKFKTVDYEDGLFEDLRDPIFAVQYLNSCLEEEVDDNQERRNLVLSALGQIMKAHGISKLSRECELNRGNLYDSILKEKNTRLDTLLKILDALQIKMKFEVA